LVENVEGVTEPFERMDATEVGPELATLREDLDRHLDRIAEIAVEAGVRRGRMEKAHGGDPEAMGSLVRTAHEVLSRRLAVERTLFADMAASDRAEVARLVEEV